MSFRSKVKSTDILKQTIDKLMNISSKQIVAGFDDKLHDEAELTFAALANMQEYGTVNASGEQHIPPRDFMSQAFTNMISDDSFYDKVVTDMIYHNLRTSSGLAKIGNKMVDGIVDSINNGEFTPLSPITINIKGDSIPLIESGEMKRNVRKKVEKKGSIEEID